jgi:hypothetical protein
MIAAIGRPTFFYKDGDPNLARSIKHCGIVYDVVNDHFVARPSYAQMCLLADVVTCGSEVMREIVQLKTGRDAVVIDDPYETEEQEPACLGNGLLWFGHSANLASLRPYADLPELVVCSNGGHVEWSLDAEALCLRRCAAVLLTGGNPGASSNRVVKSLRAGRFVIAPNPCESWRQFEPYIWTGSAKEGIAWALNNREEACQKVVAGQKYTQEKFHPTKIAGQWTVVFDSIWGAETRSRKDGSA